MPIECMVCKATNPDTASFCNNCGARLATAPREPAPEQGAPRPQAPPEATPYFGAPTSRPATLPEETQGPSKQWADPRSSDWSVSHPGAQAPVTGPLQRLLAAVKAAAKGAVQEQRPQGEVRRFAELTEPDSRGRPWSVRIFQLHSFDEAGNRRPPVQVEMRALHFDGWINEGDEVVLTNFKRRGGRILASEVSNKTTRTIIKAKGSSMWPPPGWVWNLIWVLCIVLVVYACSQM
jgi:hypothetical protein